MSFTSAAAGAATVPRQPCWRDVYLMAAARAVSYCGDLLAATALVLALQARGAGGVAVAAVLLASSVPMVLLAPLSGRLADRVDSRVLLTGVGLAQAAVCVVLAYTGGTVAIVALVALLGAGLAVSAPTSMGLVPAMVGRRNMPRAAAVSQTAGAVGMLAGPALAGVLVDRYGLRLPLLLDAASYLAIAGVGLGLRTRRGARSGDGEVAGDDPAPPVPDGGAGTWRVRDDRLLALMIALAGAVVAAVCAINVADVFFVRDTLHSSATAYGLLGAVWIGCMAIGSWGAARLARTDRSTALLLMVLFLGTSAGIAAMATVPSVGWLVPLVVLGGITNGGENACAATLLGRRVPAVRRGHAAAVLVAVVNGANALGFLAAGALLEVFGPREVIGGAGVLGLAISAACLGPVLRAVRQVGSAPGAPPPPGRTRPGPEPAAVPVDAVPVDAVPVDAVPVDAVPAPAGGTPMMPRPRDPGEGTVGNHERTAAAPGRTHPVP